MDRTDGMDLLWDGRAVNGCVMGWMRHGMDVLWDGCAMEWMCYGWMCHGMDGPVCTEWWSSGSSLGHPGLNTPNKLAQRDVSTKSHPDPEDGYSYFTQHRYLPT